MLPDLRIVIVAVISTFLFTVGVGFYTSSRLMNEPRMARSDAHAALDDSPINRIALNWPEPVQQTSAMDLDFAVTTKGPRNPVRDLIDDPGAIEPQPEPPSVRTSAVDRDTSAESAKPSDSPLQKSETIPEPPKSEASVAPATSEPAEAAPPVSEPAVAANDPSHKDGAADIVATPPTLADSPSVTSSVVRSPEETAPAAKLNPDDAGNSGPSGADARMANRSDPDDDEMLDGQSVLHEHRPLPRAKPARPRPALRKAVVAPNSARRPAKIVQRPARIVQRPLRPRVIPAPAAAAAATTPFFPFNFLGHTYPN